MEAFQEVMARVTLSGGGAGLYVSAECSWKNQALRIVGPL